MTIEKYFCDISKTKVKWNDKDDYSVALINFNVLVSHSFYKQPIM